MKTMLDVDQLIFSPPGLGGVLYLPGPSGGGSKIYDRSPYGNAGTITGAIWVRLPSGLWCLDFDGIDDNVSCSSKPEFYNLSQVTLMAWVKSTGSTGANQGVFGLYDIGTARYVMFFLNGDGTLYTEIETSSGVTYFSGDTTGLCADSKWHFIASSYNGASVYLYLDGILDKAPQARTGDIPLSTEPIKAGMVGAANYFKGLIVIPRVYNRFLSAFDIKRHFEEEKHLFGVW